MLAQRLPWLDESRPVLVPYNQPTAEPKGDFSRNFTNSHIPSPGFNAASRHSDSGQPTFSLLTSRPPRRASQPSLIQSACASAGPSHKSRPQPASAHSRSRDSPVDSIRLASPFCHCGFSSPPALGRASVPRYFPLHLPEQTPRRLLPLDQTSQERLTLCARQQHGLAPLATASTLRAPRARPRLPSPLALLNEWALHTRDRDILLLSRPFGVSASS